MSASALTFVILIVLPSTAFGVMEIPQAPDPVSRLEDRLRSTYMALPRDDEGLPDSSGVRYLARRYLEGEHGLVVKGLDTAPWLRDGRNASQAAALRASELFAGGAELTTSGPLLAALSPEPGRGFTLREAAEVVLALEEFVASYDAALMHRALALSKILNLQRFGAQAGSPPMYSVGEKALMFYAMLTYTDNAQVLRGQFSPDTLNQAMRELTILRHVFSTGMEGEPLEKILTDAAGKAQVSPDVPAFNTHAGMRHLRNRLYQRLLRGWCPRVRGVLSSMDHEGSGQVEFRQAYATKVKNWHFTETPEYLGAVGQLAEKRAKGRGPGVLIPNYVSGVNNCEVMGAHPAMFCCPDECEADIFPRLEAAAAGPRIAPKQVWAAL